MVVLGIDPGLANTGFGVVVAAFLFGVGFGVMLLRAQRQGDGFGAFYVRRMGALLAFGIINQLFLFWGDILVLYAVLGAPMVSARREHA